MLKIMVAIICCSNSYHMLLHLHRMKLNIWFLKSLSCSCFQVFRKFGVEKFDPINEQFDPHRHLAVFQIPDASKPPATVAAVLKVICHFSVFSE